MNPILKIILYLFKKNNIDSNTAIISIKSFFNSGIFFPKFVMLALQVDEIPNIHLNPVNKQEREENNAIALQFLIQNSEPISISNPSFETDPGQNNLLVNIITNHCFSIDEQDILSKCNAIVEDVGIHLSDTNSLISWKILLSLLKVLSGGSFQEEDVDTNNLYKSVKKCFKRSKIPFIINKKSLEDENRIFFFIQIEILFDFYSEKVEHKLAFKNSPSSSNSYSDKSITDGTDTDTDIESENEEERIKNLFPKNYNKNEYESEIEEEEKVERSKVSEKIENIKFEQIEVNDYDTSGSSEEEEEEANTNASKSELLPKESKMQSINQMKKRRKNKFALFQSMQEDVLLKTINALSAKLSMNKYFNCFHEAIEDDWIPKFVKNVLHIESIENVYLSNQKIFHGLKELSNVEQKNISAVIEFLKKKEPKFEVLSFNFSDQYLSESSTISFYANFLNFFFLKKSKKELIKRCFTILFPTKFVEKDELNILTTWNTYVNLAYFVVNGKKMHLNIDKIEEQEIFKQGEIPIIIDKNFLNATLENKEITDGICYQLQFIFDALDVKFKNSLIAEYFLYAISKLKEIHVPPIDFIKASIRAKNISLILQIRRYKEFLLEKQKKLISNKNEVEVKNDKESKENEEEDNEGNISMCYLDRLVYRSNKIQKPKNNHKILLIKIESTEEYWNHPNLNYIYKNGILINNALYKDQNNQLEFKWKSEISKIFQKYQLNKIKEIRSNQKVQLFDDPYFRIKKRFELFKIFIYDEQEKTWKLNQENLNSFAHYASINSNSIKTPLILFLNSHEQESISISSKLISSLYPLIDENDSDIFVYALCDRNLAYLSYEISQKDGNRSNIKPIFLLLHVPNKHEHRPDIQCIVTSIYSFLSLICDFNIILLDEKYYQSQIEMCELISKINSKYEMKIQKKMLLKTQNIDTKEDFIDEIIDPNEDNDESLDDDFDYEYNDDDVIITKNIKLKRKSIFLINETNHEFDTDIDKYLNESRYFKDILKSICNEITATYFINVNDSITYKPFLCKLNEFSQESKASFNVIKEKMEHTKIFSMNTTYISLKMSENWQKELEKIINQRFFVLMKADPLVLDYLSIVSNLQKEISSISMPFDSDFKNQCNIIISDITKKINQKNREVIMSELETSSSYKIKTLNQYKNYEFLSNERVENIIINHIQFIKNEFFNIIKTISDEKHLNIVYEENKDILDNQISKHVREIRKISNEKISECDIFINKKSNENQYDIGGGTNYSIREGVNIHEIKVQIESGANLTDEFDQDF